MPLVSVIIAAYNSEDTIAETIFSVLNQTFKDLEVIVIDDGSKDNTSQRIREIEDSRVKLFLYENGGVAKARNRGITHASGEYIAFLDHDDLWTPDKIEAQVSALQKSPDAGVAYSWTINMYADEDPIRFDNSPPLYFEGNVYEQLLCCNFIGSGSNILARSQAIASVGEFDPLPVSNEDWDFYIRLAARWSFVVVPQYHIIYRHSADSMSSQVKRLEEGGLILIEKTYRSTAKNLQHYKNLSLYNHYIYCSELYLASYNNSSKVESKPNIWEAYRTLWLAVSFCPSALVKNKAQIYIIKLLSMSILTPRLIRQLKRIKRQYVARRTFDPKASVIIKD